MSKTLKSEPKKVKTLRFCVTCRKEKTQAEFTKDEWKKKESVCNMCRRNDSPDPKDKPVIDIPEPMEEDKPIKDITQNSTKDEVFIWFRAKYSDDTQVALQFKGLNGKEVMAMSRERLCELIGLRGDGLHNELHPLTQQDLLVKYLWPQTQKNSLKEALFAQLNKTNIIFDEIQRMWDINPSFLIEVIQMVDSFSPELPYKLILVGTPRVGKVEVEFDPHTKGRLSRFIVPSFSGIEIYSLLRNLFPNITMDVFIALWSCFDGIPGLYLLATQSLLFDFKSFNIELLMRLISEFVLFEPDERAWIDKTSGQNGYTLKDETERNNATLERLKNLGIITQNQNILYLRDKLARSYIIASNNGLAPLVRLQNLRGLGLETLTKSIAYYIFQSFNLEYPQDFYELSKGYGEHDLDAVYINGKTTELVIFSCKMNAGAHSIEFMNNIDVHFRSSKPKRIILFLCSFSEIPKAIINSFVTERKKRNFEWDPLFVIHGVNLSDIIEQTYVNEDVLHSDIWPHLNRTQLQKRLKEQRYRILHIIGRRRVGKTTLVKEVYPDAVFFDFNLSEWQNSPSSK